MKPSNLGIELRELVELLAHNHEAEFTWRGHGFMLQPVMTNLIMYRFYPDMCHLCKVPFTHGNIVGEEAVKRILNTPCLDGHSFIELQDEIHVDEIS